MFRCDRAVSLLLARERGARRDSVQPAPHAPLALAHADGGCAPGGGSAPGGGPAPAAALVRLHADGGAGARAAAPAQHPRGLPPGAPRRPRRPRRARARAAARRAARRQRHALLLRL